MSRVRLKYLIFEGAPDRLVERALRRAYKIPVYRIIIAAARPDVRSYGALGFMRVRYVVTMSCQPWNEMPRAIRMSKEKHCP